VSPDPVLHLLAGPNGSGKTTLARRVLMPATDLPFVNADDLAAERWPGEELSHAYDASDAAAQERSRRIEERSSFITETVFSHPSKLELVQTAQAAGYLVHLHVVVIPEQLSVQRVVHRVRQGGHAVPVRKIRQRYRRLWPLVAQARDLADLTFVYDNSTAARPFRLMASYELGQVLGTPSWPAWTPGALTSG
jgi:predicted ABC-type ATPase